MFRIGDKILKDLGLVAATSGRQSGGTKQHSVSTTSSVCEPFEVDDGQLATPKSAKRRHPVYSDVEPSDSESDEVMWQSTVYACRQLTSLLIGDNAKLIDRHDKVTGWTYIHSNKTTNNKYQIVTSFRIEAHKRYRGSLILDVRQRKAVC